MDTAVNRPSPFLFFPPLFSFFFPFREERREKGRGEERKAIFFFFFLLLRGDTRWRGRSLPAPPLSFFFFPLLSSFFSERGRMHPSPPLFFFWKRGRKAAEFLLFFPHGVGIARVLSPFFFFPRTSRRGASIPNPPPLFSFLERMRRGRGTGPALFPPFLPPPPLAGAMGPARTVLLPSILSFFLFMQRGASPFP